MMAALVARGDVDVSRASHRQCRRVLRSTIAEEIRYCGPWRAVCAASVCRFSKASFLAGVSLAPRLPSAGTSEPGPICELKSIRITPAGMQGCHASRADNLEIRE
jgi:hypothetical protein